MKELNFAQERLIGLEVCSYTCGDGKIMSVSNAGLHPIKVEFKERVIQYTRNGYEHVLNNEPSLMVGKLSDYPPIVKSLPIPAKSSPRFIWDGVAKLALVSDIDNVKTAHICTVSGSCVNAEGKTRYIVYSSQHADIVLHYKYAWNISKE